MVPLYLKYIPLHIYSFWLATGNILAWIASTDPGLTVVLQQQVADAYGKKDFTKVRRLIGGGLMFSFIVLILAASFGLIAFFNLPELLNITLIEDRKILLGAFAIAIVGTSLMIFSFGIAAINSGLQGSIAVGLINMSVTITSILVTFMLLKLGFGLMALSISLLFSGVCFSLFQGAYLFIRVYREEIKASFSFKGIKELARLLSYTFISRTMGTIASNIDLIIVSRLLGPESVAVLALTRKSSELSREFINQPTVAFQPAVSHAKGEGNEKKLSEVLTRLICILIWVLFLITGGLISFNESFVALWVGQQFFAGNEINLIICISLISVMIYNCLSQLCFALGDVKGTSLVMAIHSIVFIPISIAGTYYFGLLGTVWAPILSFLLVSIWYFPRKFAFLIKLSRRDINNIANQLFFCAITVLFMAYTFSFLTYNSWIRFFTLSSFYCIIYTFIIFILSSSFRHEISLFMKQYFSYSR